VYGIIEDIISSTAHLEVHSTDLGVQIHKKSKFLHSIHAFIAQFSHCIIAIYYCGDTVHVKLFAVKVISYLSIQMTTPYP